MMWIASIPFWIAAALFGFASIDLLRDAGKEKTADSGRVALLGLFFTGVLAIIATFVGRL